MKDSDQQEYSKVWTIYQENLTGIYRAFHTTAAGYTLFLKAQRTTKTDHNEHIL